MAVDYFCYDIAVSHTRLGSDMRIGSTPKNNFMVTFGSGLQSSGEDSRVIAIPPVSAYGDDHEH